MYYNQMQVVLLDQLLQLQMCSLRLSLASLSLASSASQEQKDGVSKILEDGVSKILEDATRVSEVVNSKLRDD